MVRTNLISLPWPCHPASGRGEGPSPGGRSARRFRPTPWCARLHAGLPMLKCARVTRPGSAGRQERREAGRGIEAGTAGGAGAGRPGRGGGVVRRHLLALPVDPGRAARCGDRQGDVGQRRPRRAAPERPPVPRKAAARLVGADRVLPAVRRLRRRGAGAVGAVRDVDPAGHLRRRQAARRRAGRLVGGRRPGRHRRVQRGHGAGDRRSAAGVDGDPGLRRFRPAGERRPGRRRDPQASRRPRCRRGTLGRLPADRLGRAARLPRQGGGGDRAHPGTAGALPAAGGSRRRPRADAPGRQSRGLGSDAPRSCRDHASKACRPRAARICRNHASKACRTRASGVCWNRAPAGAAGAPRGAAVRGRGVAVGPGPAARGRLGGVARMPDRQYRRPAARHRSRARPRPSPAVLVLPAGWRRRLSALDPGIARNAAKPCGPIAGNSAHRADRRRGLRPSPPQSAESGRRLLLASSLIGVLLLSLAASKRSLYLVPLLPALAVPLGLWLDGLGRAERSRWDRATALLLLTLAAFLPPTLWLGAWGAGRGVWRSFPAAPLRAELTGTHLAAAGLAAVAVAALLLCRGARHLRTATTPAGAWLVLPFLTIALAYQIAVKAAIEPLKSPHDLTAAVARLDPGTAPVAAYRPSETTLGIIGFDLGRQVRSLSSPAEVAALFSTQPADRLVLSLDALRHLPAPLRARLRLLYDETATKASPFVIATGDGANRAGAQLIR